MLLRATVVSGWVLICGLRKSSKEKKNGAGAKSVIYFCFYRFNFKTNNVKLHVMFTKCHVKVERDYRARIQFPCFKMRKMMPRRVK